MIQMIQMKFRKSQLLESSTSIYLCVRVTGNQIFAIKMGEKHIQEEHTKLLWNN